jgi:peptide/nickel transport system permease protein
MNAGVNLKSGHFVDPLPFDPGVSEPVGAASEEFYRASSWRLTWWKFKRHRVAVAAAFVLLAFYAMVPFVEVIAPYNQTKRNGDFLYAPPQGVHLMHEGRFVGPFVYPYKHTFNLETFRRDYVVDRSEPQALRFFCRGDTYEFWGLIPASFHLVCPPERGTMFLLGTDRLGRDLFSRISRGAASRSPSGSSGSRLVRAGALLRRASQAISAAGVTMSSSA